MICPKARTAQAKRDRVDARNGVHRKSELGKTERQPRPAGETRWSASKEENDEWTKKIWENLTLNT